MSSLSIIIPTLNEEANIPHLLERIQDSLRGVCEYEIIFIDDHSSDNTLEAIRLAAQHSQVAISAYSKQGRAGKAYSLLEGFEHARYEYLCVLDADLQYPPEAIPAMFVAAAYPGGADIVVANRMTHDTNLLRRGLSRLGRRLYGEWLHNLDCDVQSGLKLFRAEVAHRVAIQPTAWTFDLAFLVRARSLGYTIRSVNIPFAARQAGRSKVHVLRSGWEIFSESVKIKLFGPKVIASLPPAAAADSTRRVK